MGLLGQGVFDSVKKLPDLLYFQEVFLAPEKGPNIENTPFTLARLSLDIMPRSSESITDLVSLRNWVLNDFIDAEVTNSGAAFLGLVMWVSNDPY